MAPDESNFIQICKDPLDHHIVKMNANEVSSPLMALVIESRQLESQAREVHHLV